MGDTRQILAANTLAYLGGTITILAYYNAETRLEILAVVAALMLCIGYPVGLALKYYKDYQEVVLDL